MMREISVSKKDVEEKDAQSECLIVEIGSKV
jgi:hypothetical protein